MLGAWEASISFEDRANQDVRELTFLNRELNTNRSSCVQMPLEVRPMTRDREFEADVFRLARAQAQCFVGGESRHESLRVGGFAAANESRDLGTFDHLHRPNERCLAGGPRLT